MGARNDKMRLTKGWASLLAFAVGFVGSILGMSEAWYTGVVWKMIGEYDGDLSVELGFLFKCGVSAFKMGGVEGIWAMKVSGLAWFRLFRDG